MHRCMPGRLLPYLLTLTKGDWRLFSSALLCPCGHLPVRKQVALCSPDFPPIYKKVYRRHAVRLNYVLFGVCFNVCVSLAPATVLGCFCFRLLPLIASCVWRAVGKAVDAKAVERCIVGADCGVGYAQGS